jgi:hypothetical protein
MRYFGNNNKLVQLIAVWMILAVYPWLEYFIKTRNCMPQTLLEGLAMAGIVWVIVSALGLALGKDAARLWTVWMFAIYFVWNFYIVCFDVAPFFSVSLEWVSKVYNIPLENLKGIALILIVTHIMWPLLVVMYLTNPTVKTLFNPMAEANP